MSRLPVPARHRVATPAVHRNVHGRLQLRADTVRIHPIDQRTNPVRRPLRIDPQRRPCAHRRHLQRHHRARMHGRIHHTRGRNHDTRRCGKRCLVRAILRNRSRAQHRPRRRTHRPPHPGATAVLHRRGELLAFTDRHTRRCRRNSQRNGTRTLLRLAPWNKPQEQHTAHSYPRRKDHSMAPPTKVHTFLNPVCVLFALGAQLRVPAVHPVNLKTSLVRTFPATRLVIRRCSGSPRSFQSKTRSPSR